MSRPYIRRGDVWWVSLDPTQGSEIQKTRPCVVLTHDVLNARRRTVVVVPLSSAAGANPPITVPASGCTQDSVAVVDQVRAVALHRLKKKAGVLQADSMAGIEKALKEILVLD